MFNGVTADSKSGGSDNLTVTATGLMTDTGTATTVGLTIGPVGGDDNPPGSPANALFRDYLFHHSADNSSNPSFTISGMGSAPTADLYFYPNARQDGGPGMDLSSIFGPIGVTAGMFAGGGGGGTGDWNSQAGAGGVGGGGHGGGGNETGPANIAGVANTGGGGGGDVQTGGVGSSGTVIISYPAIATTPYGMWAATKGLDGTAGKENGLLDDPDGDGTKNIVEFATNGDPLSGADNGRIYSFAADSDYDSGEGNLKELILTVAVRTGTAAFSGTPLKADSNAADAIRYTIEGSLDLSDFSVTVWPVTPIIPIDPLTSLPYEPGAGYEFRSFSLEGSNGLPTKGFLRAKVESNP